MRDMTRSALLGLATVLFLVSSCLAGPKSPAVSPAASERAASSPSACQDAPQALLDRLGTGLGVRGAYVSNVSVAPADDLGTLRDFSDPWWVAGRINGVGVRQEVGVWLWSHGGADAGAIRSANASSGRYFDYQQIDGSLASSSRVVMALIDCVGPIPQP